MSGKKGDVKYTGSCHCGLVKYEVLAAKKLQIIECNCTVCKKKQNRHFIVPACDFKLLSGHTELTTYTFESHNTKHMFCSRCGVQSFYIPRSNPDGMAIIPHCIDGPLPLKFKVEKFNGQDWEIALKKSNIQERSKH